MEGKTLSHFRIQSKIGEGGMGVIYKAEDTKLGRTVALKLLPPALVGDEGRKQRFISEARAAAAVTHPNIATVHEIDEVDGNIFIAMELLDGETLRAHIGGQSLPIKEALRIAAEVAEGIAAAHQAGVLHRDLKPENVMIGKDGHVRILDFGLAQLAQSSLADADSASTLTAEGHILGTPAYMSPEQARGKGMDSRSDIFSFGSTLYEMITGRTPFAGRTATDTISQVLNQEPMPAVNLNPDVPESLQWILSKCLNKDPSERYQDARDIAVDLRHILTDSGSQAPGSTQTVSGVFPQAGAPVPLWKRPIVIGGAVLVIAAAFLIPRLLQQGGLSIPPAEANSLAVFSFENLKDPSDPERLGQILQELLITDLSDADPVKVLSSQRLYDIQKQLGIGDESGGKEFTTRIATQAGAAKMLTGSLSQLGDRWILAAQVVDVQKGTVIQSKRIDGTDLFAMVDILTDEIQSGLRITAASELAAAPVKEKTTSSLDAYRHYLAGVDLISENDFAGAVEELQKAIELDPDFGQAHYKLAIAHWWPGTNPMGAIASIKQILDRQLYASEDERLMAEATLALIERRWRDGLETFETLSRRRPEDKEVWYGMGEGLFHFPGSARRDESLAPFQKAVKLDPDFRLPYQHIFDVYLVQKDADAALNEANALLERDSSDPLWHRFRALAVAMGGDKEKTEQAIEDALVYNTNTQEKKDLFKMLQGEPDNRGDYLGVVEYMKRAIAVDPTGSDPRLELQLAGTFDENLQRAEYERHIREGFARYPTHPGFLNAYWGILASHDEWPRILAFAESLSTANPDHAEYCRWWLHTALEMGDKAQVKKAMVRAEKLHHSKDQRRSHHNGLHWAYRRMGREQNAIDHLNQALDLTPELDPNMHGMVATAARQRGDHETAGEAIRAGLALKPDHTWLNSIAVNEALDATDFKTADKHVQILLDRFPLSRRLNTGRFVVLLHSGRTGEAQQFGEEALEKLATPDDRLDFLRDQMRQYLRVGELELARKALEGFKATDPGETYPGTIRAQGGFSLVIGDLVEAEQHLLRGLKKWPNDAGLLRELVAVRLVRGDYAGADEALRQRIKDGRIRPSIPYMQGYILADQGEFQKALSFAEQAAADSSRDGAEFLAWVLVAGEIDLERGLALAQRTVKRPPDLWNTRRGLRYRAPVEETLGLAALKQERYADAVEYLEQAAVINPNRPSIQEDLKRAQAMATGAP